MTKLPNILLFIMAFMVSVLAWALYSLWIEYRAYQAYAQTEIAALDSRIMDAQVDLIEMKSTCNAYLYDSYPDSGNDFSR